MKKFLLQSILTFFLFSDAYSQAGMWTWMHGDSVPNSPGVFGTQGVPSPLNYPSCAYESCEWTDLQGNFWLFGGAHSNSEIYSDLWKYNPATNQWTWIKGNGLPNNIGNFGVKGVPSLSNLPPSRGYGTPTWVDLNGDFWFYSGGNFNDLWKYNITTNTWTWMHGDSIYFQTPIHGIQGIPDSNNTPGARSECAATWIDSSNNLWLFGGLKNGPGGFSFFNDLWKYNTTTNEWTWMKGSNLLNQPGNYGIKGIPNVTNVPGARMAYSGWKDGYGNFWLFGGGTFNPQQDFNDMWKYDPLTNIWTWMSGTNVINNQGNVGAQCIPAVINSPEAIFENRCCIKDNNGNFWFFAGGSTSGGAGNYQLWFFNPLTLEWAFISGNLYMPQYKPVYGVLGIPSPLNKPGDRKGTVGWFDSSSNCIFAFGGAGAYGYLGDLWRYQIDPNCPMSIPTVNLSATDTLFCEKQCINFFDLSTNNPTSWQWFFPGSDSLTSTLQNPTNICYNNYGTYDVTLIACNANGCDTLTLTNFISCYQNPADSIYQSNDTLFSLPAYTYQWYEVTGGIIAGATNQYFIPQQAGSYYCIVSDTNGCVGSSGTIVITGMASLQALKGGVIIIPNPFDEVVSIEINRSDFKHASLTIKNVLGQSVFKSDIKSMKSNFNFSFLTNGVFVFEITIDENKVWKKMVRQ